MIIDSLNITTDFNGIVIFSYPEITEYFGGKIHNGQNILREFTETDLGDYVLDKGSVIPIINIDDGEYFVRFLDKSDTNTKIKKIFKNSGYLLEFSENIYIADAAVFWDWETHLGWKEVKLKPGKYEVSIEGVHHTDDEGKIISLGYDIIVRKVRALPLRTAKIPDSSSILF